MNSQEGLTSQASMTQEIQRALANDPATSRYPIEVMVEGANVTISGDVDSQQDKETAERITKGVSGVVFVTNELVVRDSKGPGLFGLGKSDRGSNDATAPFGGVQSAAERQSGTS